MSGQGVILFAHGARDARWAEPFVAVRSRLLREHPYWHVELAFLELMPPSLGEAAQALVDRGCTRLMVLPMFLGAGGHVRRDLPLLVQQLREQHRSVHIEQTPPLGEMAAMLDAMAVTIAHTVEQAAGGVPPVATRRVSA